MSRQANPILDMWTTCLKERHLKEDAPNQTKYHKWTVNGFRLQCMFCTRLLKYASVWTDMQILYWTCEPHEGSKHMKNADLVLSSEMVDCQIDIMHRQHAFQRKKSLKSKYFFSLFWTSPQVLLCFILVCGCLYIAKATLQSASKWISMSCHLRMTLLILKASHVLIKVERIAFAASVV